MDHVTSRRIARVDRVVVHGLAPGWGGWSNEPMEGEAEMVAAAIDQGDQGLTGRRLSCGRSIQLFQVTTVPFWRSRVSGSVWSTRTAVVFGKHPQRPPTALSDHIQVPHGSRKQSLLTGDHAQAAALERLAVFIPNPNRPRSSAVLSPDQANSAMPHRFDELVRQHPGPVVND